MSCEDNDLGNDQFCNTSRVGKGRVEDCDAVSGSIFEVDLVGTNAEAAYNNQVLCLTENLFVKLGLGSDTNNMHISKML